MTATTEYERDAIDRLARRALRHLLARGTCYPSDLNRDGADPNEIAEFYQAAMAEAWRRLPTARATERQPA